MISTKEKIIAIISNKLDKPINTLTLFDLLKIISKSDVYYINNDGLFLVDYGLDYVGEWGELIRNVSNINTENMLLLEQPDELFSYLKTTVYFR